MGIGVTVYAGFQTTIAGVSVRLVAKLGCELVLHGPPVFGQVKVDWYVIGFTIPIGNQDNDPSTQVLDWTGFEEAFLPKPTSDIQQPQQKTLAAMPAAMQTSEAVQQVVKWTAQQGLEQDDNNGESDAEDAEWVLNPFPWKLTVESAIPSNEVSVTNSDTSITGSNKIGVRPMGKEDQLEAPLVVTLKDTSGTAINLKERNISLTGSNNGAPAALWARTALNTDQAPDPKTMLLPGALFGLVINADSYVYNSVVPEFPLKNLEYVEGNPKNLPYSDTPKYPAAALIPESSQQKAFSVIMQTIMSEEVIGTRNAIYQALQASAINAPLNPDLSVMASSANLILQDFPVLAHIGIYQNGGVPQQGTVVNLNPSVTAAPETTDAVHAPFLVAQRQSYKVPGKTTGTSKGLPVVEVKAKGEWKTPGNIKKTLQLPTERASTESRNIYDGTSLVWEVSPTVGHDVNVKGDLPVLITSFDEYGSLLAFDYQETPASYSLPSKTGQILIEGYDSKLSDAVGWQVDTKLSKVNGTWKQGDGCLVRVQNSRNITPGKGKIGNIKVSELLRQNKVRSAGGVTREGWVQTVFSEQCTIVGLLMKGKVDEKAIKVSIETDHVPSKAGNTSPYAVKSYNENTLFLFQVPDGVKQYSGTIVTLVDQQVQLLGMYGLGESWASSKTSLESLKLVQAGIDFKSREQKIAQINLTQKTSADE